MSIDYFQYRGAKYVRQSSGFWFWKSVTVKVLGLVPVDEKFRLPEIPADQFLSDSEFKRLKTARCMLQPSQVQDSDPFVRAMVAAAWSSPSGSVRGSVEDGQLRIKEGG